MTTPPYSGTGWFADPEDVPDFKFIGNVPNLDIAPLAMWVLYDNPRDVPGFFVLRRFLVKKGKVVGKSPQDAWCCRTAEPLRAEMRKRGLHCMARHPSDEPHIVETWL